MSLMETHPIALGLSLFGLAYLNALTARPRDRRPDRDGPAAADLRRPRRP